MQISGDLGIFFTWLAELCQTASDAVHDGCLRLSNYVGISSEFVEMAKQIRLSPPFHPLPFLSWILAVARRKTQNGYRL